MGIVFTDRQQQVIDTRVCNLLVSAAAGSGKTAVLTERIVKMVAEGEHPVDIDRLLVVTFTNAAAAEMRERISRALQERLAADPLNEHLQRQTTLIHNAQITTIDSFCLSVLRNQFHTIGLDPGFRIMDEGESKLIRQEVLAQVLEEAYAAGEPSFLDCMEYFSMGRQDRAVEEVIWKLYDFAMSTPFPERWLQERKQDYRIPGSPEDSTAMQDSAALPGGEAMQDNAGAAAFDTLPWVRELMRRARLTLEYCGERLRAAIRICEKPGGPYMYAETLERELLLVEELAGRCGGDYDGLRSAFETLRFDRLPSKKDDTVLPDSREDVKNIRAAVKDCLAGLQKRFFTAGREQTLRHMQICGGAVDALADITLAFKRAFDRKKRERNVLDFDDVEHLALSVLVSEEDGVCRPTDTAREYRDYFYEILTDEYQDSNLVQEYILSCISGEEEGRYNRFMVGDVKQSIYRFRLARPELFMEKYDTYRSVEDCGDGAKECGRRIDLHQNFRSRVEVLHSVNAVFERIMGREAGGIAYDEAAALHPGAAYPAPAHAGDNTTELLLFRTDETAEELTAKEQEAYGVAARIHELMRTFRVVDQESGAYRPVAYRDIVILLRTMSGWDDVFQKILEQEGIPVYVASRTGYFAAPEVQELLHFLRVLDNPLQDIPLYGVLHAYLGGFTEEEIAAVRAAGADKQYLYDALKAYAQDGGEPGLRAKMQAFLARIERFRELAVYLPVQELLQVILRETGYADYAAVRPEGGKRRANVEMLLVKAAEYEKTSFFGLYHFLRYMEQLEKYEVDYGEAGLQDENADVVRLMSIHKSKGLEFPVCFVSGLSKRFQTRDVHAAMVLDIDNGIGVPYIDTRRRIKGEDLRRNLIADKIRTDSLAEELRILYVGMTRAKEKLILTGTLKTPEKTAAALRLIPGRSVKPLPYGILTDADSFLDLLLSAVAGSPCLDEFYRACGMEAGRTAADAADAEIAAVDDEAGAMADAAGRVREGASDAADPGISVVLSGWEDRVEQKLEETVRAEDAKRRLLASDAAEDGDEKIMTDMSAIFSYRYPHETLAGLYAKTTVSELKMAGMREETDASFAMYEEETVVPYLPGFLEKDERVTGSLRGTAFHKVMELFDFQELTIEVNSDQKAAEALLQRQIEAMRRDGRLPEDYYEAVSIPKITRFLTSRTALRMADAARRGRLYKEQPFVMGLGADRLSSGFPAEETVLIQGIIDVFFEEDGGYVLLDYKTDAVETAEELVKRYRVQLDYYAEALQQAFGAVSVDKMIYSFKLGMEIPL